MTASRNRRRDRVQADVQREAYSVREFAAALGFSLDSIYNGIRAKEIPHFKLRGEYRIPGSFLSGLLTEAQERAS